MRLFVGIALADDVTAELARLRDRLRKDGDGLRWTAIEGWHVTLQFLGNADLGQLDCLKAELAEVRSAPVPVRLGALEAFERAGAFVIDVTLSEELLVLQHRVVAATKKCGFVPEDRPYHPHITLARAKGDGRRMLKDLKAPTKETVSLSPFIARDFLLYESNLGPGGAKYEVKAKFPLAEPEG